MCRLRLPRFIDPLVKGFEHQVTFRQILSRNEKHRKFTHALKRYCLVSGGLRTHSSADRQSILNMIDKLPLPHRRCTVNFENIFKETFFSCHPMCDVIECVLSLPLFNSLLVDYDHFFQAEAFEFLATV